MDAQHFKAPLLRRTDIWKLADEFAGRLLVPLVPLKESLDQAVEIARTAGFTEWDASGETALGFIANHICHRFGVSAEVIARCLRIEQFWPPK